MREPHYSHAARTLFPVSGSCLFLCQLLFDGRPPSEQCLWATRDGPGESEDQILVFHMQDLHSTLSASFSPGSPCSFHCSPRRLTDSFLSLGERKQGEGRAVHYRTQGCSHQGLPCCLAALPCLDCSAEFQRFPWKTSVWGQRRE